jgi:hypothetical protein
MMVWFNRENGFKYIVPVLVGVRLDDSFPLCGTTPSHNSWQMDI